MNRVVHFEIHAIDLDRMQKFYEDIFGWKFQGMGADMGNYRVIMTGPGPRDQMDPKDPGINGGMTSRKGSLPTEGQPVNAYVCIIGVQDIDATIEKIKSAGGTLATQKMDVPNVGLLAYYKDPEGNLFGIIQPVGM